MVLNHLSVYPQGIKNPKWVVDFQWPEVLGNLEGPLFEPSSSSDTVVRAIPFIAIRPKLKGAIF